MVKQAPEQGNTNQGSKKGGLGATKGGEMTMQTLGRQHGACLHLQEVGFPAAPGVIHEHNERDSRRNGALLRRKALPSIQRRSRAEPCCALWAQGKCRAFCPPAQFTQRVRTLLNLPRLLQAPHFAIWCAAGSGTRDNGPRRFLANYWFEITEGAATRVGLETHSPQIQHFAGKHSLSNTARL